MGRLRKRLSRAIQAANSTPIHTQKNSTPK